MDGLLERRKQLAEGILGLYSQPPVDPSPGANPLFQQIFANYQPPQPDYIGQVNQRVNRLAGWLMLPYLAWLCFAGALNIAILMLNPMADAMQMGI